MQTSDIGCCCCGIIAGFMLAVLLTAGAAGAYLWYKPEARQQLHSMIKKHWQDFNMEKIPHAVPGNTGSREPEISAPSQVKDTL